MKKICLALVLICCFFMTGCQEKTVNETDNTTEKMAWYQAYYDSVLDNERFVSSSDYFDCEVVMNQLKDGSYRYDVLIDNPKIAMYGILAVVVEDNVPMQERETITPSFGILDSEGYAMIPNQVNKELGYIKGIDLSGIVESDQVNIKLLVLFKDSSLVNQTRVYLELNGSARVEEEVIEEESAEDTEESEEGTEDVE